MKHKFFTLILAIIASWGTLSAKVQIGELYYNLNSQNQTAEVTYHLYKTATNYANIETISIPASVSYGSVNYTVTSIGTCAFYYCTSLTNITIPNTVTTIGNSAFAYSSLTEIIIPNSVTSLGTSTFLQCAGLSSVNLSDNITSVGYNTFSACINLLEITIPNNVTRIETGAFNGCSNLATVSIGNNVASIARDAFRGCSVLVSINATYANPNYSSENGILLNKDKTKLVIYPNGRQGAYAIPNNVTTIGEQAFAYCTNLTEITISESVTSIEREAFYGCMGITSIVIPNSVTSFGSFIFAGCSNLTSPIYNTHTFIYMPDTYIGDYTIPNGITTISAHAFSNCYQITNIIIPNSVTTIGEYAFYGTSIQTINLPNGVMSLGSGAFSDTQILSNEANWENNTLYLGRWLIKLRETYVGEYAVKENTVGIYDYAFSYCNNLTSITIPNSVISIGTNAFVGCELLQSINFLSKLPPTFVGEQMFWPIPRIYVPCGTLDEYQSSLGYLGDSVRYYPSPYTITAVAFGKGSIQIGESNICETKMTAIPDHGYHFTQWNDEVTKNPRYIYLTQDTTFTAAFAKNPTLLLQCDTTMGRVYYRAFIDSIPEYENAYEYYDVFAVPNEGYHFVQWSDSSTEQTFHTVHITNDAILTALFAKNKYEIKTEPNNPLYGQTFGDTIVNHGDTVEIEATPYYGYHFSYWNPYRDNNGDTIQQRAKVVATKDQTYIANFDKNHYTVQCNAEAEKGYIQNSAKYPYYLDTITLTASSYYGYHFTQWSDGNKNNPRTFVLTQDTTFTAEFDIDRTGFCGDAHVLTWQYDKTNKLLTIKGNGSLNSNYTFGIEAPNEVQKLVVAEGVTTIGQSAFANYTTLQEISLPTTVKTIYEQAFYNCIGLTQIYNYRERPCVAYSNTFDGIDKFDCTLHVLSASVDLYKAATGWRDFYYIETLDAETVTETTDEVVITPTETTANIIWPIILNAVTYELVIRDLFGNVICTLIFNAQGRLITIAFAPGRNGTKHNNEQTEGFSFTVTGLDSNTSYEYSIVAKDENEETLDTKIGNFTTIGVTTSINTTDDISIPCKILYNGQIVILHGDKTYTLTGQEIK